MRTSKPTAPENDRLQGLLPSQWIRRAIERGQIVYESERRSPTAVQPASLDLHLGKVWMLPATAVPKSEAHPSLESALEKYPSPGWVEIEGGRRANLLSPNFVYLTKCPEHLSLPSHVFAMANPKSSVGRLDVHVRLVDRSCSMYDRLPRGYEGALFLEIVPRSFSVLVAEGEPLAQLRFVSNSLVELSQSELEVLHEQQQIVRYWKGDTGRDTQLPMHDGRVVLTAKLRGAKNDIVAFRSRTRLPPYLDMSASGVSPREFWEPIYACDEMILEPGEFYIVRSQELLSIPPSICAEMQAFDETRGEFRAHYAGFFDNGFGFGNPSAAVLEMRNHHSVPMRLCHGQRFCSLRFLRFAEPPSDTYGGATSHYQGQRLKLAKQFADW